MKWRGPFSLETREACRETRVSAGLWLALREALVCINSRMRSFVLERFPMWGRAKMLGVLLSRLTQLFLVHKLFFRACFFFSSLSSPMHTHSVHRPIAECFWLHDPWLHVLSCCSWPGWAIIRAVCLTSQCHLFAEQKDLEGLRGYGFKNPNWMEERVLSPASNYTLEHCFLPKHSASILLPAAMPALSSTVFYLGTG